MTVAAGLPVAGSFVTEIQSMMHGFGDARSPLPESASLIESIVQQQQRAVISQAADMATMRGSKCIGPEDILFLLRKDRIKMHRLMKYLGMCCWLLNKNCMSVAALQLILLCVAWQLWRTWRRILTVFFWNHHWMGTWCWRHLVVQQKSKLICAWTFCGRSTRLVSSQIHAPCQLTWSSMNGMFVLSVHHVCWMKPGGWRYITHEFPQSLLQKFSSICIDLSVQLLWCKYLILEHELENFSVLWIWIQRKYFSGDILCVSTVFLWSIW